MRTLGMFAHKVIGSAGYFAEHGVPETPDDLRRHFCLHHRFPTTGKLEKWPFRPTVDGSEIELPVTAVASTLEPLISLAELGGGLICVPDFTVRRQLDADMLRIVLEPHLYNVGTFRILWPSGRNVSPKVKAFVDFMGQRLFPRAKG
jgi:DNA-binding transcriptional LysR family regulator